MPTATGSRARGVVVVPASKAVQVAIVAALLTAAFWGILSSLYGSWFDVRAYMEHGILVMPAAGYMVWTKRARIAQIPAKPSMWSIPLLVWGAAQASLGIAAHWIWVSRTAFLISLVGCIAALFGLQMVRELGYPLATLILMIAPPTFIYERLTLSLQLLASRLGEGILETLGYSVMREGNILEMVGMKLSVEEACSGIRSLFAILFVCVLYNYFFVQGNVTRMVILVMAVPMAILGNVGRIVATGIASQRNVALARGAAHDAFGYASVTLAALGCLVFHLVLVRIRDAWRARRS